jgi:hypothetical protein
VEGLVGVAVVAGEPFVECRGCCCLFCPGWDKVELLAVVGAEVLGFSLGSPPAGVVDDDCFSVDAGEEALAAPTASAEVVVVVVVVLDGEASEEGPEAAPPPGRAGGADGRGLLVEGLFRWVRTGRAGPPRAPVAAAAVGETCVMTEAIA